MDYWYNENINYNFIGPFLIDCNNFIQNELGKFNLGFDIFPLKKKIIKNIIMQHNFFHQEIY